MSKKTKAEREAEAMALEKEAKEKFMAGREKRLIDLLSLMSDNTDIFTFPKLTVEMWDQLNFTIRINEMCPFRQMVSVWDCEEHFKFYENEENFANLERAIVCIISTVREAQDEAKRFVELRRSAIAKLTDEERRALGIK